MWIFLSVVGCGRKIDGVLAADLLAKIGATTDLKRQTMYLKTVDDEREMQLANELHGEMARCVTAFNDSDDRSFGDFLEPGITLFTQERVLTGEAVLQYLGDGRGELTDLTWVSIMLE